VLLRPVWRQLGTMALLWTGLKLRTWFRILVETVTGEYESKGRMDGNVVIYRAAQDICRS
jgi:hypothetical protein